MGGGGEDNDESCVSMRAGERERGTVKRKSEKGRKGGLGGGL